MRQPDITRSALLAHLGVQGPTSRADLARDLGVSPALVSQNVKALLREGLVEELDMQPSQGGRPARLLGLRSQAGYALGVKVAADHVTMVEVTIEGRVLRSATEPIDASFRSILDDVTAHIRSFMDSGGDRNLLGIGVGIPGVVEDEDTGTASSTQLGWANLPLGAHLQRELNLPVLVDNNVNALAIAETLYGRVRDYDEAIVATIGTGIGGALIHLGMVVRGRRGGAGELGHVPYSDDGPRCQCGARGCAEAYIGESALVEKAVSLGLGESIDAVVAAANRGDEKAVKLFSEAGHIFGRTLAAAVNLLSPDIVVVLGEGAVAWQHWAPGFEPSFRSHLTAHNANVPVMVESWQDDRWAQGAAALVLATPFDNAGQLGEQGRLVRQRLAIGGGDHVDEA